MCTFLSKLFQSVRLTFSRNCRNKLFNLCVDFLFINDPSEDIQNFPSYFSVTYHLLKQLIVLHRRLNGHGRHAVFFLSRKQLRSSCSSVSVILQFSSHFTRLFIRHIKFTKKYRSTKSIKFSTRLNHRKRKLEKQCAFKRDVQSDGDYL